VGKDGSQFVDSLGNVVNVDNDVIFEVMRQKRTALAALGKENSTRFTKLIWF